MYSDNSLTPREAIRLCALGILAQSEAAGNLTYDELVYSVRYFVSMLTGPSLDLMGESIELLRHEDLVEIYEDGTSQQKLKITEKGFKSLNILLLSSVRPGNNDLNELVMALKFRFFSLLSLKDQVSQIDNFIDVYDIELIRLEELLKKDFSESEYLFGWLELDADRVSSRLKWLKRFRESLTGTVTHDV